MLKQTVGLLVLGAILPVGVWSQDSGEAARLTVSERLEQRFASSVHDTLVPGAGEAIVVDGREHPEQLLPWELFERLLALAFMGDPESSAALELEMERVAPGLLEVIERHTQGLLTSRKKQRETAARLEDPTADRAAVVREIDRIRGNGCAQRAAAMVATANEYGGEKFLGALYEVVAPTTSVVTTGLNSDPAHLRWVEEGCP